MRLTIISLVTFCTTSLAFSLLPKSYYQPRHLHFALSALPPPRIINLRRHHALLIFAAATHYQPHCRLDLSPSPPCQRLISITTASAYQPRQLSNASVYQPHRRVDLSASARPQLISLTAASVSLAAAMPYHPHIISIPYPLAFSALLPPPYIVSLSVTTMPCHHLAGALPS